MTSQHNPILTAAVAAALRADEPDVKRLIDGTVGGGGHTSALLEEGIEDALACDLDADAIAIARERLALYGERVRFYQGSYVEMAAAARALGWRQVDAILLDLGLSSMQLDDRKRGFSFRYDAPLDMRFDAGGQTKAHDLVNGLREKSIGGPLL